MKTATVQLIPQEWPKISQWLAAGEKVEVIEQDAVVAKLVPVKVEAHQQPTFWPAQGPFGVKSRRGRR